MPRSGPGSRGGHPVHPPPSAMGPPGSYGGSGSHKDIKLTLLNKVTVTFLPIFKGLFTQIEQSKFSHLVLSLTDDLGLLYQGRKIS